jgi:hypothetical protein
MADLRAALWPESPPDLGWSKRVFNGTGFNTNMTEQQAVLIAQAIRVNRRAVYVEPRVRPSRPDWIVEDSSAIDTEGQDMMSDYEGLADE